MTIPFSEVDEVVWFPGNGVLLPVSNEHNPTQVHTYKIKGRHPKLIIANEIRRITILFHNNSTVDLEIFVYRNFRMINFRVKIFS